ncbi:MAG: hypothetical protein AB7V15_07865, partial [Acidimicrobiia bacterium]
TDIGATGGAEVAGPPFVPAARPVRRFVAVLAGLLAVGLMVGVVGPLRADVEGTVRGLRVDAGADTATLLVTLRNRGRLPVTVLDLSGAPLRRTGPFSWPGAGAGGDGPPPGEVLAGGLHLDGGASADVVVVVAASDCHALWPGGEPHQHWLDVEVAFGRHRRVGLEGSFLRYRLCDPPR